MAMRPDLEALVAHHDAQLEQIGNRMGVVENTLCNHSVVLQEIKDAVVKQSARPSFDPRNTIGIVKDIGVVFAMVCAGILYLAAQNGSADVALLKDHETQHRVRIEKLETLLLPSSWSAERAR